MSSERKEHRISITLKAADFERLERCVGGERFDIAPARLARQLLLLILPVYEELVVDSLADWPRFRNAIRCLAEYGRSDNAKVDRGRFRQNLQAAVEIFEKAERAALVLAREVQDDNASRALARAGQILRFREAESKP